MGKRSFLVTGGSGFIGSSLVRRLVKEGHAVRVLDDQSRGAVSRLSDIMSDIEFIDADIRDSQAVSKAVKGVDSVAHLAFVNGTEFFYSMPDLVLDVGVKGMVNVIDACRANNVRELILASSSEVYQTPGVIPTPESVPLSIPDPLNPRYSYAAGKIISEIMAVNYGRKYFDRVVIFRPHNVYGPAMGKEHVIPQFIIRMKQLSRETGKGPIPFPIQGSGRETRAFIFIDDFTAALIAVINKGEHMGIYHIGTEDETPISRVAELVGQYFGKDIRLIPSPPASGGTTRRCPDTSKIKALGFRPGIDLKKGVFITAEWYDNNL